MHNRHQAGAITDGSADGIGCDAAGTIHRKHRHLRTIGTERLNAFQHCVVLGGTGHNVGAPLFSQGPKDPGDGQIVAFRSAARKHQLPGLRPTARAIAARERSSAARASCPSRCTDEALPNVCSKNGRIASRTRPSRGVVAA